MNKSFLAKIFFGIIFAGSLNAGEFKQKCEEAKGSIEEEIYTTFCQCQITKQRFDPDYSICEQTGIEDRDKNPQLTPDLSRIVDYVSLLQVYEKNECHADFSMLQKATLQVMRGAFEKLKLAWKDPNPNTDFATQMGNMWEKIFKKINSTVLKDKDYSRLRKLYPEEDEAIEIKQRVILSINEGIIPLPVYDDLDLYFRTSAMIRSLYIGIAPIYIKRKSIKQINQFHAHPLSPLFTSSLAYFAYHDIQHANLLAKNLQRMGLTPKGNQRFYFSEKKCQAIQNGLTSIINTSPEDKSFKFFMPAYFYIHEMPFVLNNNVKRRVFLDFVLEFWQNHVGMSVAEMVFGKNADGKSDRVKEMCHQVYNKINEQSNAVMSSESWKNSGLEHFFLKFDEEEYYNRDYEKLLFNLAKECFLTYDIEMTENPPSVNQYILSDEINKSLNQINFHQDFYEYFNKWEKARQQFLQAIEKSDINPNLKKKWNDNCNMIGRTIVNE